jgi:hypothetical protein
VSNKENAARDQRGTTELDAIRADILKVREAIGDMANMVLPPAFRGQYCECGSLACRVITAVRPGETEAQRIKLCADCKLGNGWTAVGALELSPHDRETVAIANRLGVFKRTEK